MTRHQRHTSTRSAFRRVWAIPLTLGGVTTIGLVAALLGVGVFRALAWGALTTPIVVVAICLRKNRSVRSHR